MATITPAILAGSQEEYKYQIERIANFAERRYSHDAISP